MRAPASRYAFLILLLPVALALPLPACGGDEDEATPEGTAAAAASATPGPSATSAPSGQFGPGVTDSEIIIGAHSPLTGALAAIYATIPKATTAYFNYINDTQGGVCGRKIVYKVQDDNYDAAKALEVTRKLVEQDKVLAIVGALGAHPSAFDYLNQAGVPDLLLSTASHRFISDPQTYPWTVLMIPDYTLEGTYFGQYISENLPGEKVAVLYENTYFGIEDLAGLEQGLDPAKNQVVSEQPYDPLAVEIRSQVTNMKNSGAEVAVLLTTPGYTVQAVKAADRLGWEPQFLASYVNSDDTMFQFASPELLEGMITFQALKMSAWKDDPAIARHYEIMSKYGGPAPSNFTVYAQALAELAVEVLSRACHNLTRQGLMDAIESIRGWRSDLLVEGVDVTISDTDHAALDAGRMLRVVVENGKGRFEYFGPVYYLRQ
jgi:ABC-type branched-subunit amino acid transport system substrate-binding protein